VKTGLKNSKDGSTTDQFSSRMSKEKVGKRGGHRVTRSVLEVPDVFGSKLELGLDSAKQSGERWINEELRDSKLLTNSKKKMIAPKASDSSFVKYEITGRDGAEIEKEEVVDIKTMDIDMK